MSDLILICSAKTCEFEMAPVYISQGKQRAGRVIPLPLCKCTHRGGWFRKSVHLNISPGQSCLFKTGSGRIKGAVRAPSVIILAPPSVKHIRDVRLEAKQQHSPTVRHSGILRRSKFARHRPLHCLFSAETRKCAAFFRPLTDWTAALIKTCVWSAEFHFISRS